MEDLQCLTKEMEFYFMNNGINRRVTWSVLLPRKKTLAEVEAMLEKSEIMGYSLKDSLGVKSTVQVKDEST